MVFVRPDGTADDWIESDLWHSALGMPGVTVVVKNAGDAPLSDVVLTDRLPVGFAASGLVAVE